jgi:hypothetical protein
MMKKLVLAIFMLGCFYAKGQEQPTKYKNYAWEQFNKPAFSVGAEFFGPTKSPYTFGYGLSAKGEKPLTEDLSLSFTTGFVRYAYKDVFNEVVLPSGSSNFVPLKAGVKYFLGTFYFESEPGVAVQLDNDKKLLFAIELGTGFIVKIGERNSVDIQARYENWGAGKVRATVLRVAYRIDWM